MSGTNNSGGGFGKLLTGVVIGLVIGLAAGIVLGPVLDRRSNIDFEKRGSVPQTGTPADSREDRPVPQPTTPPTDPDGQKEPEAPTEVPAAG